MNPGRLDAGWRVRHLTVTHTVSMAALLVGAIGALIGGGPVAAAGFVAGMLLVMFSYTLSTLGIAWADSVNRRLILPVGLGLYVVKFTLFGFLMVAINHTGWGGRVPMAVGIVVGVFAWTGAQIWWTTRRSAATHR